MERFHIPRSLIFKNLCSSLCLAHPGIYTLITGSKYYNINFRTVLYNHIRQIQQKTEANIQFNPPKHLQKRINCE